MAKICPNCGTHCKDSDVFCAGCGGNLAAPEAPRQASYASAPDPDVLQSQPQAQYQAPQPQPQPQYQPQQAHTLVTEQVATENFARGCIGALIGAIIGGVAIFLLGMAGVIASAAGLVLAFLTFFLYEKMAGGTSIRGTVVCVILIAAVPYIAFRLYYSYEYVQAFGDLINEWAEYDISQTQSIELINEVYGTGIRSLGIFEIFPELELFLEVDEVLSDFHSDLLKLYGFTALGAVGLIVNQFSRLKKKK